MQCAIRDNAEQKVWNRLGYFRSLKLKKKKSERPVVGVLGTSGFMLLWVISLLVLLGIEMSNCVLHVVGCMAERLKTRLLDSDRMVDLVVGPDAYRHLPDLISVVNVRVPCTLSTRIMTYQHD